MTLIVPAAPGMLEDATRRWAEQHGARIVFHPAGDEEAYYRLFADEWQQPGDLLIVEHDMVPAPGVTDAMTACRRPWCSSPYQIANGRWLDIGTGCVKLAERLKTRHPELIEQVGRIHAIGDIPARSWRRMDVRLAQVLRDHGYQPHLHRRSLHLHDYRKRP